jgi:hypothetical protein
VNGLLFRKVCPRCKRKYPKNFTACLECGATLIDTEKDEQKDAIRKYLPFIGMVLICGGILAVVLFVVFPLIQYSLSSGQEIGTISRTEGTTVITPLLRNETATDGRLQVAIVKIRDGARSTNGRKFIFVTTILENLRTDMAVHVAASDFTLIDATGQKYPSYGIGDKIAQDIDPLSSQSYDLLYEIPDTAENLKIQYLFPASAETRAKTVIFLL